MSDNPDKKARYDQFGLRASTRNYGAGAGGEGAYGAGGFDFGDLGDIFGSFSAGASAARAANRRRSAARACTSEREHQL